ANPARLASVGCHRITPGRVGAGSAALRARRQRLPGLAGRTMRARRPALRRTQAPRRVRLCRAYPALGTAPAALSRLADHQRAALSGIRQIALASAAKYVAD